MRFLCLLSLAAGNAAASSFSSIIMGPSILVASALYFIPMSGYFDRSNADNSLYNFIISRSRKARDADLSMSRGIVPRKFSALSCTYILLFSLKFYIIRVSSKVKLSSV